MTTMWIDEYEVKRETFEKEFSREVENVNALAVLLQQRFDGLSEMNKDRIALSNIDQFSILLGEAQDAGAEFFSDSDKHRGFLRALYYSDVDASTEMNEFRDACVGEVERSVRGSVPMYLFGEYPRVYVTNRYSDSEIEKGALVLDKVLKARREALHRLQGQGRRIGWENASTIDVMSDADEKYCVRLDGNKYSLCIPAKDAAFAPDDLVGVLKRMRDVCPVIE